MFNTQTVRPCCVGSCWDAPLPPQCFGSACRSLYGPGLRISARPRVRTRCRWLGPPLACLAMMADLGHGAGSDATNCRTRPCPFRAIGLRHDTLPDEVLVWWRRRCLDFLLDTDSRDEGPWPVFIQAMAVKSIMRKTRDRATGAPSAPAAAAEHTGAVTSAASTCMGGSPGSSGLAQVLAPPGHAAEPAP